MSEPSSRRVVELTGAGVLGAGAVMILSQEGSVDVGWEWMRAFTCVLAGLALLAVSRPTAVLYAGVVERLAGNDPRLAWALRAGVLLTAPLAGAGVVLYSALGMLQVVLSRKPDEVPLDWRRSSGTGLVGLGIVLAAQAAGLTVGSEELLWSAVMIAAGLVLFWVAAGRSSTAISIPVLFESNDRDLLTIASLGLTVTGAAYVLDSTGLFQQTGRTIVGAAVVGIVLALVVGPRWLRTSRQLRAERLARARANERAELAAHLHDSVLQTLALIQRRSDDPSEVATLARRQERELRSWLNDPALELPPERSIATAIDSIAAEVEDAHRIRIEVVSVGDGQLNEGGEALLAAIREALVNVARHAGGASASVFLEIKNGRTTVFVRDRGPGFDPAYVPEDRRGIRESIVGRMKRHGGSAEVRSAPGDGCEVELVIEAGK